MHDPHILFVDDNLIFSWGARESLAEFGFDIESVYCGEVAMRVIDRRDHLSALVTDIDLGPGPNGFEVARHARAGYPRLPVVYMSGAPQPDYAKEAVRGSEFLAKPFAPQAIANALNLVIRRKAA